MSPKNDHHQKYCAWWLLMGFLVMTVNGTRSANNCQKNGLYRHPTDCTRFYSCAPDGPVLMRCTAGLHFNEQLLACDWPESSGCVSNEPDLKHKEEEDCPIHPDPTDCAKFYMCSPSGRVAMDCPPGLRFNPRFLVCDWPEHTECFDGTSNFSQISSVNDVEVSTVSLFDDRTTTSIMTSTETTTYQGFESTGWTEVDTEEMLTETTIPDNVKTSSTDSYKETTLEGVASDNTIGHSTLLGNITTTEQQEVSSMCGAGGGIRPHASDCTKFYMSSPAGILTLSCPGDTLFNPETLLCDLATNVACFDELVSTTTVEDGTSIATNDVSQLETESTTLCKSSMWPHPTDCAKYFKCGATGPVEMVCSDELLFNPVLLVCDWPGDVECSTNNDENWSVSPEISTMA